MNGVYRSPTTDYTESSTTSITLTSPATIGNAVVVKQRNKGLNWQGVYDGGTAYVVDDGVSYNGGSYICILASTGNVPTNTTYWEVLASKGDDGTNGTNGTN